jgi:hypothetical protein
MRSAEDQYRGRSDPLRAQPEPKAEREEHEGVPLAWKILELENAVDAISDAEKPISQCISERAI